MALTKDVISGLLEIGIRISSETDINGLWEDMLKILMKLTSCDAATFYILKDDALHFRITKNNTFGTEDGLGGSMPKLPPVALDRSSVCAISALDKKTIIIDDVYSCTEHDLTGPRKYDAITGYKTVSMLVVPMLDRGTETIGVLQLINAQDESGGICSFSGDTVRIVEAIASQAAVTIENVRYTEELREMFDSVVRLISAAVDERTPYNGSHTRHMAEYAERWINTINAESLSLNGKERFSPGHRRELISAVWLHDLGKLITPLEVMNKMYRLLPEQQKDISVRLGRIRLLSEIEYLKGHISEETFRETKEETVNAAAIVDKANSCGFMTDEMLEKVRALAEKTYTEENGDILPWILPEELRMLEIRKGTLSAEEREIMERHVSLTDSLLSRLHFTKDMSNVRKWASSHHELLNGSGYPEGLKGDEIPEEVRMITILDIFDALTADDRPYKPGMPTERALGIITDMAEREQKLDPELVNSFKASCCWETAEK